MTRYAGEVIVGLAELRRCQDTEVLHGWEGQVLILEQAPACQPNALGAGISEYETILPETYMTAAFGTLPVFLLRAFTDIHRCLPVDCE